MRRRLFVFWGAMFLFACGGGTSGAPSITNLTYTPQTAAAGADTIYDVAFDFDTTADVTMIEFEILNSPAGPSKTPQDFPITGAAGVKNGTINAKLDIIFQTPGSYEFGIDILDTNQRASNQLTGVITVQ